MPKKQIFTETWIRNLKSPATGFTPYKEHGRRGFLLRVYAGGAKVFFHQFSWDGKAVFLKLLDWFKDANALARAHREHEKSLDLYTRGINPKNEREAAEKARQAEIAYRKTADGVTIRNVIAEWGWHFARKQRKRPREAIRLAMVYFGKPWAARPARELTKRDAVLLLDRLVTRGSNVMARRVRSLGLQIFNFAVARDLVTVNPFVGTLPPGEDEQPRERKLTVDEIRTFWRALDRTDIEMSRPVRLALRLILVTGQRPGEVSGAPWSEIDTAAKVWTIAADRAKNGRAHEVPLTDLALELIEELRTLAKERPHLFPSVHSKLKRDEPLSQRALSRALRNNHDAGKLFGLAPFTPHDLRRTAASMMTSLGIQRLHVSKVLNHTDQDITGLVYDQHGYFPEKKRALEVWETELRAIIEGKARKVVPLRKSASK